MRRQHGRIQGRSSVQADFSLFPREKQSIILSERERHREERDKEERDKEGRV